MKRLMLLTLMMLLGALPALAETTPSARVWLDGGEVSTVYETAVSHQRFWTENPALSSTPAAIATHSFPCEVEIAFDREVHSAVVRPLALGVTRRSATAGYAL